MRFLLSLIITWTIEVPVLLVLVRLVFRERAISPARILCTGLLCSALSLPYLWFVLPPYVDAAYYPVAGELLAMAIEAVMINQVLGLDVKRSLACSVLMNAASFFLGRYLL